LKEFNWIAAINKNSNTICFAVFVIIIAFFSLRSIQEAYFTLPSFDGALNLQVPENLIKYGRYATNYHSIVDFDKRIQSGAPLLVPIYFMFLSFGKSAFVALLVSSIYLILAAVMLYHLTAINTNRFFALICLVLFILTPFLLEYGHHIYGEIPALFYFLSSLAILYRLEKNPEGAGKFLPFLAGFLFGLSYLTKTVMFIAVPSIVFFFIIDLLFIHKLKKRHYGLMLIGFILPVLAFECYKLIQLGADAYPGWWQKQYSSIMFQAGVKEKYADTPNLFSKMLKHTEEFCKFFRMNTLVMLCFLCMPPIVFVINFLYHLINKKRDQTSLTLAILYGTACTYMVWWIFITPTARAWPRRIVSGYILQEIALVISLYFLWKFLSTTKYRIHLLKKCIGALVLTVMLFIILFQSVGNSKHIHFLFKDSQEKLDAERVAKTIGQLPETAKIYGFKWWQAPILSFLSNRVFFDFTKKIHPEYPVKLKDSYIAIDYPDALKYIAFRILNKTKKKVIERQGYNYLFQIEYISDYSYANTYRNNRIDAMVWLANRSKPSDKIVIAQELQINKYEQRLFTLRGMYIFARSEEFKKLKQADLINATDGHILRDLQSSPKLIYEKPEIAIDFFQTNKIKNASPVVIIKKGSEITEKWIAGNFVTYVVGYDNIVVNNNVPFYDPQFRKSLKKLSLPQAKPIKRFARRGLNGNFFYKEPRVSIYEFDIKHTKLNLINCEVSSKSSETGNIISLYRNGYVETPSFRLKTGTHSILLYAKGTKVNGIGPRIKVELYNDKGNSKTQIDELEITSADYQRYETKTFQTDGSNKRIKILFYNDKYEPELKQDRNFYLKELLIAPCSG